jgi:hypothetical protein
MDTPLKVRKRLFNPLSLIVFHHQYQIMALRQRPIKLARPMPRDIQALQICDSDSFRVRR